MQSHIVPAITIADFCSKYKVHRSTFYRNLKRGVMPRVTKIGSASRILYEDERSWLDRQHASEKSKEAEQ